MTTLDACPLYRALSKALRRLLPAYVLSTPLVRLLCSPSVCNGDPVLCQLGGKLAQAVVLRIIGIAGQHPHKDCEFDAWRYLEPLSLGVLSHGYVMSGPRDLRSERRQIAFLSHNDECHSARSTCKIGEPVEAFVAAHLV